MRLAASSSDAVHASISVDRAVPPQGLQMNDDALVENNTH